MIVKVHMMAFGEEGEIRNVEIPDDVALECNTKWDVLDAAFRYGQNEVQRQPHLSVSSGDVAELKDGSLHVCLPIGWDDMTAEEFEAYKRIPRRYRGIVFHSQNWREELKK